MPAYYSYDEAGRVSSIWHFTSGGAQSNREESLTAYFSYDEEGRLTNEEWLKKRSPASASSQCV